MSSLADADDDLIVSPVERVAEAVLFIVSRPRSWRVPVLQVDPR